MRLIIYIVAVTLLFSLIACSDKKEDDKFSTSPISGDYSYITDHRERWEAYNLSNYVINEGWTCECFPPNSCKAFIKNGALNSVEYTIDNANLNGRTEEEINNYVMRKAMTVEQAFLSIENYINTAHYIKVEYHEKYGFPTSIYINPDSLIADEEIHYSFGDIYEITN